MPMVATDNGEMRIEVDWLSVSIPRSQLLSSIKADESVKKTFDQRTRKMANLLLKATDLKAGGGRAPFNKSFHSKEGGYTYYESDKLPYCLIEFTGVGCERLRSFGWMESLVKEWHDRVTRLDISVDIATDINPITFMRGRTDESKFKSTSQVISESGITCYIGSKTSDRYTRVYRYNPPHPRSDLLRVEFVLKADYAKQAAAIPLDTPIHEVAKGLFSAFGWEDISNLIAGNGVSLTYAPKETHQGKTERWLLTQVLPAIQRLSEVGNMEFIAFFQERIEEIRKGG